MKIIAIICEYNPFHKGHAHQIDILRDKYPDSGIVCIMSGNFVQRAEPAIFDKFTRARAALIGGADLVLELPFPYSSAGAECFASAGVHIANSLSCVDMLSFGSECGDIKRIEETAKNLISGEFLCELDKRISEDKSKSYASVREEVYEEMYGGADILSSPNNILAVEYVKALGLSKSIIRPVTHERKGSSYNDTELVENKYASASALRSLIRDGKRDSLSLYIPSDVFCTYQKCESANVSLLERGIIANLRLAAPECFEKISEASGGLGRRIAEAARDASDLDELFSLCATKKYTNARIRRALFNYLIGVRESDIKTMPRYTQLLAANDKGRKILKMSNKNFNIITKPADYKSFDAETKAQIELSHRADSIYSLMLESGGRAYDYITSTPYIE